MTKFFVFVALLFTISAPVFSQTVMSQPSRNGKSKQKVADARIAIDELRPKFIEAYNKQDADAVAQFYAEDATYIGTAGDVVEGRDKLLKGLKGELPVFRNFTVTPAEFSSSGDLAYERGAYSARLEIPNRTPETVAGKYLLIYRRQADGKWKIQTHMSGRDRAGR